MVETACQASGGANVLEGRDIICVSTSDWERPWGSRQHLMTRLARRNRVLFVEYQASALDPWRYPEYRTRYVDWLRPPRREAEAVWRAQPCPMWPGGAYLRSVNRLNQWVLGWQVRGWTRALGFDRPILWCYPPTAADLVDAVPAPVVVYHCLDPISEERASRRRRAILAALETRLAARADLVLCTTEQQYEHLRRFSRRLVMLPIGVDREAYESAALPPPDVAEIPAPRLGVIGTIDDRLDCDLLERLLAWEPTWQLVLVGVVRSRSVRELARRHRRQVHVLGYKAPSDVPGYVHAMDACLIPYRLTPFAHGISPLKALEALAAGRPLVATPLPALEPWRDLVHVAGTPSQFHDAIRSAMEEDTEDHRTRRRLATIGHDWDDRVAAIRAAFTRGAAEPTTTTAFWRDA